MLTREDVERIIDNRIAERGLVTKDEAIQALSIEMKRENWINPNGRTVVLKWGDQVISTTSFDVVQQREYEG